MSERQLPEKHWSKTAAGWSAELERRLCDLSAAYLAGPLSCTDEEHEKSFRVAQAYLERNKASESEAVGKCYGCDQKIAECVCTVM